MCLTYLIVFVFRAVGYAHDLTSRFVIGPLSSWCTRRFGNEGAAVLEGVAADLGVIGGRSERRPIIRAAPYHPSGRQIRPASWFCPCRSRTGPASGEPGQAFHVGVRQPHAAPAQRRQPGGPAGRSGATAGHPQRTGETFCLYMYSVLYHWDIGVIYTV